MTEAMTENERDAVARFPSVAREFCRFIDNCNS